MISLSLSLSLSTHTHTIVETNKIFFLDFHSGVDLYINNNQSLNMLVMLGWISLDIKVDMKVSKFLGMHPLPKKTNKGFKYLPRT
jgi:hypothetical protein